VAGTNVVDDVSEVVVEESVELEESLVLDESVVVESVGAVGAVGGGVTLESEDCERSMLWN
jgi:hypothetical protein